MLPAWHPLSLPFLGFPALRGQGYVARGMWQYVALAT